MELSKAKEYLRVDTEDDDDDALIDSLITASDKYLENAGAQKNAGEELYEIAQMMLITHWYENREPVGDANKLAFALDSILFQLKWCGTDESGTTTT